jgi:hypothetical protein
VQNIDGCIFIEYGLIHKLKYLCEADMQLNVRPLKTTPRQQTANYQRQSRSVHFCQRIDQLYLMIQIS